MGEKKYMNELKKFIENVNKSIKIQKIILFGSRAAGDFRKESDIDLMIVSPEFEGKNFFERVKIMYNYWELDYAVDFLCYTPKEFNELGKKISIVSEAIKSGVEIK